MITLTCMGCGTSFSRSLKQHNASIKRGRKIVACSYRCVNLARGYEYNMITAVCQQCGAEFSRKKRGHDTYKYCSQSCAAKSNNAGRFGARGPKFCQVCKTAEVYGKRRTCDNCKAQQRYSQRSDWTKVTLQELRDKYSVSQYHAKIRGMSRSEYARHKGIMACVVCGYDLHVDIAHIAAVKDFDLSATLEKVNHIDNLTALCPNHHWEFDNGHLTLS